MQILLQMLTQEAPVEKLAIIHKGDPTDLGTEEAPAFSLDIARFNASDDEFGALTKPTTVIESAGNIEPDGNQLFDLGTEEFSIRKEAPVVKSAAELNALDLKPLTNTENVKSALPLERAVQNKPELVGSEKRRPIPDRIVSTAPVIDSDVIEAPRAKTTKAPVKAGAIALPLASLSNPTNVAKTDVFDTGERIIRNGSEKEPLASKQVGSQSNEQVVNTPRISAERIDPNTAKAATSGAPDAKGDSNTPLKDPRLASTPVEVKKDNSKNSQTQFRQQTAAGSAQETPLKPAVVATKPTVPDAQLPNTKVEGIAVDEGRGLLRASQLEAPLKDPVKNASPDMSVVKRRSETTPIEILYKPNKTVGAGETRAIPSPEDNIVVNAPRDTEKVVRGEAIAAVAVQKTEPERRDSKSPAEQRASIRTDAEPQVQQTNGAQSQTRPQPIAINAPAFLPNLGTSDYSGHGESIHVREGELHLSVEGPESRRETVNSAKIEPFARPVLQQLNHAAKTLGNGSVEIKLSPEELGKVRLSLNPGETNVTVHISAERPETLELIRRNIELLSQSLKQEGFTSLSFSFGNSGGDQAGTQNDATPFEFSEEPTEVLSKISLKQAPIGPIHGQLDIRI